MYLGVPVPTVRGMHDGFGRIGIKLVETKLRLRLRLRLGLRMSLSLSLMDCIVIFDRFQS
jgi:hypothetical protein